MTRLGLPLALLFICAFFPRTVEAQDEREIPNLCETREAEPADEGFLKSLNGAIAGVDGWFGDWVVGPLVAVFFVDVYFFDNGEAALKGRLEAAGIEDPSYFLDSERAETLPDPRRPWCEEEGLSAETCDTILAAEEAEEIATACGAGLTPEQVHAFVRLERDPLVGYCGTQGLSAGECKDVQSGLSLPFIVLWLVLGAIFFTLRFAFINLRAFGHALAVTAGRYDKSDDPGEVSHFQALSSALSATVGLGNIAGVAVAVGVGGPGAVFWMIVAGFLGMSSKFAECTLGQVYREVDPTGKVSGGPMRYLEKGLREVGGNGLGIFGKVLAVIFAVMCIGGSLGGGNMFQANQSAQQVAAIAPWFGTDVGRLVYGILLAALVGIVIIGGIRRIGKVAGFIVPIMCAVYVLAGLLILLMNFDQLGSAFGQIIGEAFTPMAGFGGAAGVLITGFQRAAFSNEAGVGSASIAHSAAATDEPVREGIVALLEPFIDTIVVCTMTALVVVVTGAYQVTDDVGNSLEGIAMTSWAFDSELPGFSNLLSIAAFAFAFSTMISWSYYGERCWTFLFPNAGPNVSLIYRIGFLLAVVLGSILELGNVLTFSDLMILGMAFPNILGVVILSNKVSSVLKDYWSRYKSGEMKPVQKRSAS
ncbi:MAG: alanine/glycine:cation symporter family protein [Myxococcota bacterium]